MPKVTLISPQYLKNNTVIEDNVNDNILDPAINDSQVFYVEPLLGTELYDRILDDIDNDQLTGKYKTLTDDYLVPLLKYWTVYNVIPNIMFKMTNRSIEKGTNSTDGSMVPVTTEELNIIRNDHKTKAETMQERAQGYLYEHDHDLEEYKHNSGMDNVDPMYGADNIFGGIYLGSWNYRSKRDIHHMCYGADISYPGRYYRIT